MTPEEVERARLEVERARLELERDRLTLEKTKTELSNNFFARHSAILIPAAVSFAAVVVSVGQIWVTKISKDKALEVATIQKNLELERQDSQRKRELDISAAKFISENRRAIFSGSPDEQEIFARLIPTIFPLEVTAPLLRRLERASPASGKQSWQKAFEVAARAAASFSSDGKRIVTIDQRGARVWDADTGQELALFKSVEPLVSAQFSPNGTKLLTKSLGGGTQVWEFAPGRPLTRTVK